MNDEDKLTMARDIEKLIATTQGERKMTLREKIDVLREDKMSASAYAVLLDIAVEAIRLREVSLNKDSTTYMDVLLAELSRNIVVK